MTNLRNTIKEVTEKISLAKSEFERAIADKSIALDERWKLWLESPDYLKNTTKWIHHFDAFADLAHGEFKINEFERGVLYEHTNRCEHIEMASWDEWLIGMAEAADGKDSEYDGWENDEGKKFTMKHYNAWREEVLAGNIGFVNFDW